MAIKSIEILTKDIEGLLDSNKIITNQNLKLIQENLSGIMGYGFQNPKEKERACAAYFEVLSQIEEKDPYLLVRLKLE